MADKQTVGFIGVGNMGWPMAACLVRAGFLGNAPSDFHRAPGGVVISHPTNTVLAVAARNHKRPDAQSSPFLAQIN